MSRGNGKPTIRSVKFNVVMNMILTSSSFLFPLVTVPYVSRVLGPSKTGIISWASTFTDYFILVAMLGFNMYGTRECAKVRDDREKLSQTLQELLTILLISTSIVYAVYLTFVFLMPRTQEQLPLMFITGTTIWFTAAGAEWFYRAIEQYGYITFRNIMFKILSVILMFLFVRQTQDYLTYAAINVLGTVGSNVINICRLRKYVDFSVRRKISIRHHFKSMFKFSVSSISSGMYGKIDMLLLGFFVNNYSLGLYQLVFKIRNLCTSVGGSVTAVMLPRLSYYEAKAGHEQTTRLVAKNFNFLLILGLGMISAMVICAHPIITLLGGAEYLPGIHALQIGAPLVLLGSIGSMQSQYMVASNQEKAYTYTTVFGLVFSAILECILIPCWGINGAALGLVVTEFCVYVLRSYIIRDFMTVVHKHTDYHKIVFAWITASVLTIGVLWLVNSLNAFIQIAIAGAVYLFVDLLLLYIFKEKFFISVIKKNE